MGGWIFYSFYHLKLPFRDVVPSPLYRYISKNPDICWGFLFYPQIIFKMLITFFKKCLADTKCRRTFDLSKSKRGQVTEQKQL